MTKYRKPLKESGKFAEDRKKRLEAIDKNLRLVGLVNELRRKVELMEDLEERVNLIEKLLENKLDEWSINIIRRIDRLEMQIESYSRKIAELDIRTIDSVRLGPGAERIEVDREAVDRLVKSAKSVLDKSHISTESGQNHTEQSHIQVRDRIGTEESEDEG